MRKVQVEDFTSGAMWEIFVSKRYEAVQGIWGITRKALDAVLYDQFGTILDDLREEIENG